MVSDFLNDHNIKNRNKLWTRHSICNIIKVSNNITGKRKLDELQYNLKKYRYSKNTEL
jgi:hypothetical protein